MSAVPLPLEAIMRTLTTTLALTMVFGGIMPTIQADEPDAAQVLKRKGLRRDKGKYLLAAEDEVSRLYRVAQNDYQVADQAVAEAVEAGAKNQAIFEFRNRIAFDSANIDRLLVERKYGTSLEQQTETRMTKRDRAIAKMQRAQQGLAGGRENPAQAKRLENVAIKACQAAGKSWDAMVAKVKEVDGRYKTLADDQSVREAIGNVKFGPSDGFKKLALNLGVTKKGKKAKQNWLGTPKKDVSEVIAELEKVTEELRKIPFNKKFSGYGERDRRRNQTIAAVETAIGKLQQGETDPHILDEAMKIHGGYTGGSAPAVQDGLNAAQERLDKAAELLSQ
jgi:hypothetical protein